MTVHANSITISSVVPEQFIVCARGAIELAVAAWDAIRSVVAPEEEEPTLHAVAEAATTSSTKTTR